jgi:crotonobetainyl-CoA:carnitine CoA-transferase CaiB-like acyl-CoA transferase
MTAAFALLMALRQRRRTGKGMLIDIAQVETAIPQFGEIIMDYTMNGRVQGTSGNRDPNGAIQGCYRCQGEDRWVCITFGTDEEWAGFRRALGDPEWARDERFADVLGRWHNHDELDRRIEEWTSQHEHFDVMSILQTEGVAAGPVEHPDDAYSDPQMKERSFFQELTHPECGTHLYPGIPYRMSKTPNRMRSAAPELGQHNEYVYKQVIGVSEEEYAHLVREGHIGTDFVAGLEMGKYKLE